ncbi:MAG: YafY family transcriptional regulator [Clostridia bacterium]|nr:YafY family transcriptional regulator [Clostridia bacterium]
MKISRLFSIVTILLNKGNVTAKELAEEFEVSTRTIYRDIETLSMSGIPIYTDRGMGGGIRIMDHYVLNKAVISEEEKNSILLGLQVLQATQYDERDSAIHKLKLLLQGDEMDYIEVDFSGFDNNKEHAIFEGIKKGLQKNQTLSMTYKNNQGEISKRLINPLKLIFKEKRWYLIAYCHTRATCRTFRISRILSIEETASYFDRRDYDISDWVMTSHGWENQEVVTLILKAEVLFRIEEEFHFEEVYERKEDQLHVTFETELDEWFINYVLTYADYLIDIRPEVLKTQVKEKAQKILTL